MTSAHRCAGQDRNRLRAQELSTDFIDEVTTQLYPGDTALIVEVNEGSTEPTERIVSRYGGRIYRSQLA